MKKFTSKIILSAIVILSYPGKIFANTTMVPPLAGDAPINPATTIISLVDRIIGWLVLPLGALAVVFYSLYIYLKKRKKKTKKGYLNIAVVCTILLVLAFLIKIVISFLV